MLPNEDAVPRCLKLLLPLLAAATVGAAAAPARADEAHWRDLESRIQYGYYTEDARALQQVADELAQDDSHEKYRGYYAALADWRLALLGPPAAGARGPSVAQRVAHCAHELDGVLASQPDFAPAFTLRAACGATPAGGGLHVPFTGPNPGRDIERALALSPRDPRTLFVDGLIDYELGAAAGGNRERALPQLRKAVAAFEVERAGAEPLPGWGAAEAYCYLARDLLDHGDGVGARDALEHALLLAPDYTQARRLMARITRG